MTGTIARLNVQKGFGFIKDGTGGQDYFFHRSAIFGEGIKDVREGDTVEFDVGQGQKGRAPRVFVARPPKSRFLIGMRTIARKGRPGTPWVRT